jgi:CRISPR-associated protein Cas5d
LRKEGDDMSYGVQLECWGKYALFSRPELKTERVSYDVITPSAARGIIESIFWHPGLKVYVDRIHVLNKICHNNIRRNEVKEKIPAKKIEQMIKDGTVPMISTSDDIQQRAALILRDVHYVIDFHFEMTDKASPTDNEGKFKVIFRRRIEKGQFYSQPYFGCREFPVFFRAWKGGPVPTIQETRDLGYMLYDLDFSNPTDIQPMFFHAKMINGVVNIAGEKVLR